MKIVIEIVGLIIKAFSSLAVPLFGLAFLWPQKIARYRSRGSLLISSGGEKKKTLARKPQRLSIRQRLIQVLQRFSQLCAFLLADHGRNGKSSLRSIASAPEHGEREAEQGRMMKRRRTLCS